MQYKSLDDFYNSVPQAAKLKHLMDIDATKKAKGSNHNHQTWEGGYVDHVVESMNIAAWLYTTSPRPLPFKLEEALLVMFLHDIEKPFKADFGHTWKTKEDRRTFRETLIQQNQVRLSKAQWNALEYVEGEHNYSNKERMMGEMAAFCHCCDILSARLWHNRGSEHTW
jgi:hypothetical protein